MSIRSCFLSKVRDGIISRASGRRILDLMNEFEAEHAKTLGDAAAARQAAIDASTIARSENQIRAQQTQASIVAQANILRTAAAYEARVAALRETPGDLGFGNKAPPTLGKDTQTSLGFALRSLLARDPFEVATWNNVHYLARNIRGAAHSMFTDAIDYLRPKKLGFSPETTRELDVLRALHGETTEQPQASAIAQAWNKVADSLADQFIAAGGKLGKRTDWRLPNPAVDAAKVRAIGADRFKALVHANIDRDAVIDFATGERMSDARFAQVLDDVTNSIMLGSDDALPSAAVRGRPAMANSRDMPRFFVWKSSESWQAVADTIGTHQSVYQTMLDHIAGMADDIASMRVLGPNPDATLRFMMDLFDREPGRLAVSAKDGATAAEVAAAVKANQGIESRVARERRLTENLYAEVMGRNRIPVNTTTATTLSDARHWLSATQLGSAIISSFTDPGTMALAARFNGLPVMDTIAHAVKLMTEKGSELYVAQQGLVADSLAQGAAQTDRIMGEAIRTGVAQKLSNANIRASGLRRWTASLRGAFGLEMMAMAAREAGATFDNVAPEFREAMGRYGIGAEDWDRMRTIAAHEPRPGAKLLRPMDVAEGGDAASRTAAEKFQRMIDTEMDYAVIDGDPVTRALLLGQSRPGTIGGETRRAVSMYRSFPATFVMMHFARAAARGWDGSRLGHAALTFATMTALGVVSMQSKEILAGRDPLSLDATTGNGARAWGKAMLQGGGLGVFGDMLFIDQTKYGNSWAATVAGPLASSVETILGDFVIKNIQLAGKGQPTHFGGDALYAIGNKVPGSSLWFARAAFQRGVLDQLALMVDDRARERFARIEATARKEWGQDYWLRPGRTEPSRAPDMSAVLGR